MESLTVIFCSAIELLPHVSVAVHILLIVYLFAQISLEMTSTTVCVIVPTQLSVAVTVELFATGTSDAQLTVISCGTSAI
jgi:hypothetical protein